MRKTCLFAFKIAVILLLSFCNAEANEWRFPIGLSSLSGISEVYDIYKSNLEASGYNVTDQFQIPLGVSFNPYFQFNEGVRFGAGVGPIMMVNISGDVIRTFLSVPVNINVGYTFNPSDNISPYVRGGISYPFASGDYVKEVSPGFFGAGGIEFLRKKRVSFGFEAGFDTSEITMKKYEQYIYNYGYYSYYSYRETTKKIKSMEFLFNLFIAF